MPYPDRSRQDHSAQVERVQKDPNCHVFLISFKADGYGLNLTAAENVILAKPWWNPAVESQAIDRAHRIRPAKGRQRLPPRHPICGTVEERILRGSGPKTRPRRNRPE